MLLEVAVQKSVLTTKSKNLKSDSVIKYTRILFMFFSINQGPNCLQNHVRFYQKTDFIPRVSSFIRLMKFVILYLSYHKCIT
jgi:hypothetical protein